MPERVLTLPEQLARQLDGVEAAAIVELLELGLRQKRIELALTKLAGGGVSLGAAAEAAGLREDEMARLAYARGLRPPADARTLDEEIH